MRPIATDLSCSVSVSVCVLIIRMCCAKTTEAIEVLFVALIHVGPLQGTTDPVNLI